METTQRFRFWFVATLVTFSAVALSAESATTVRLEKGTKILMDLDTPIDSGTTREGDAISFRVRHDISAKGRVALPRGTLIKATAIRVDPAIVNGKSKHAEVQIRLDEIVLPQGKALQVAADVLKFEPEINRPPSAGVPAGTILPGVLLGGLLGKRLGPMSGAVGIGAAMGVGSLLRGKPKGADVVLLSGSFIEARLSRALEVPDVSSSLPAAPPASAPAAAVATLASPPVSLPDVVADKRDPPAATSESALPEILTTSSISATPETPAIPDAGSSTNAGAFKIRVDVKLVQVDAVIHDQSGKPMTIVQKDDFRIFEDGVEQNIQAFSRDELPLAVALVIDRSGSVMPFMNRIQTAALRALQQLKPGDEVCLFSFAGDVALLEPLTSNLQRVANRIGTIQGGGGTRILDAVSEALHYLDRQAPGRRKAVILVSDNVEGSSFTTLDQATQHALEAETVIYSVRMNTYPATSLPAVPGSVLRLPTNPSPTLQAHDPVPTIARETGGEVFDATASAIDGALAATVTRLKMRYTVGYYPVRSTSGRYHSVEVRLADRFGIPGRDYTILSRRGYYE